MTIQTKRAGALAGANGSCVQQYRHAHSTPSPESCAKWLAIWRYTHGYCSLEATQAAIDAHPEWRLARSALAGTT